MMSNVVFFLLDLCLFGSEAVLLLNWPLWLLLRCRVVQFYWINVCPARPVYSIVPLCLNSLDSEFVCLMASPACQVWFLNSFGYTFIGAVFLGWRIWEVWRLRISRFPNRPCNRHKRPQMNKKWAWNCPGVGVFSCLRPIQNSHFIIKVTEYGYL